MAVSNERNAVGKVQVHTVPTKPLVINPNGNIVNPLSLF
jgi:gluconolactonase